MPVSKRRKKGLEHLKKHRAMREAAKRGEYTDALKQMMEISKQYASRELGDPELINKFDVTVVDETMPVLGASPVLTAEDHEYNKVVMVDPSISLGPTVTLTTEESS